MNDWNTSLIVGVIGAFGGLLTIIGKLLMDRRRDRRADRAVDAESHLKVEKAQEKKYENALAGMRGLAGEFERLLKEALVKVDKMQDDRLEDLKHRVRCETELAIIKSQMGEMTAWKKTVEAKDNGDPLQSADR